MLLPAASHRTLGKGFRKSGRNKHESTEIQASFGPESFLRNLQKELRMDKKNIVFLIFTLIFLSGTSRASFAGDKSPLVAGSSLTLSGFTQVEYTSPEHGLDGFRVRRARMTLDGEILKNIQYKVQVETVQSPILLDVLVDLRLTDQIGLRFGQFKVPFSLENLTSSADLDTINRSQTVELLCPGRDSKSKGRDIGIALTGRLSKLEYALGVFNGSGINKTDDNKHKDLAGRMVFSPSDFLSLGMAHYRGVYFPGPNAPSSDKRRTGIEASFDMGRVSLKGEYIFGKDGGVSKRGWYLHGGIDLIPGKTQAVVRFDSLDVNEDIQGDKQDVTTLGVNWFLAKRTKVQVIYEFHSEEVIKLSNNVFLAQFQVGF